MVRAVAAQGQSARADTGREGRNFLKTEETKSEKKKSNSGYATWSRTKACQPEVTSSPRRCQSSSTLHLGPDYLGLKSETLLFSYLGDEDETVRTDLSAAQPFLGKEIRPPQPDVFKLHRKRVKSEERIWIMRDKFCCREDSPSFSPILSPMPTPPPPPLQLPTGFPTSLNRKKISCKSVSISVVGLMSEPGSGFDNFQGNHDEADLINVFEKPLLPPPLIFSSEDISTTASTSGANNSKSNCASHVEEKGECESQTNYVTARRGRCSRYQKPLAVSLLALGFVLVMTLSVLYWNYYETLVRRSTKKQSVILDHWGKGSSSGVSSSLYPDSEYLKDKMQKPGVEQLSFVTNDRIKRWAVNDRTSLSRDPIISEKAIKSGVK